MKPTAVAGGLILLFQMATPYWWWVMVVPLGIGLAYPMSAWQAFRMGAFGAGAVWLISGGMLLLTTSKIIATRIAAMMNVGSEWVVLLATVALAMVCGGVAGLAGQALRGWFERPPTRAGVADNVTHTPSGALHS
jgi:hypothetical protein